MRCNCGVLGLCVGLAALFGADGITLGCEGADKPPGLLYSTLLNGMQLNSRTGVLTLRDIQAVFLPVPESSDTWKYNPTEGKLTARLSTASGKFLGEYRFYAQPVRGVFWMLGGHRTTTADGSENDIQLTTAGDYVLQFAVEDMPFYRFPFAVTVQKSGDEFDPDPRYHLEGAWANMGYLFYGGANPASTIEFKIWLRDKNKSDAYRSDKMDVRIVRLSDDQVVAVAGTQSNGTVYQLKPEWTRSVFVLHTPDTVEAVRAADILQTEGRYEVELTVHGGVPARFPFVIRNRAIEKSGRQLRDSTDPQEYIEGGRDAWWLQSAGTATKSNHDPAPRDAK